MPVTPRMSAAVAGGTENPPIIPAARSLARSSFLALVGAHVLRGRFGSSISLDH
jgi:hypothetical protein